MKFSYNSKSFTLFHDDNYVEIEECKNINGYENIFLVFLYFNYLSLYICVILN